MISKESKDLILKLWKSREPGISYPPASEGAIADFEDVFKIVPEDYRWFLLNCGGGVIGSEWVEGIDELFSTHTKFNEECALEHGWTIKDSFIIGWDGSGSPIAIDRKGKIVVESEDDGKIYELAPTLEYWLLDNLV